MATPVNSFLNGACQATGAYVATEYVIPATKAAVKETAKKTEEVAEKKGYAIFSSATAATVGGAVAGPPGAVVGGFLGWMSGSDEDKRANEEYAKTGKDDRCVVQ